MKTDYRWLLCESDVAGIMLLALDMREIRTKDLLRVSSSYDRIKRRAETLVDEGLMSAYRTEKPHPATTYMLTQKGKEIAVILKRARSILEDESIQGTLDMDYGSSEEERRDRNILE